MTGYEGLRSKGAWIDLSGRGLIRVTGEDRARLLHAMCTNDINNLPQGEGRYAFFLSAQGRILADAYIYNLGESLLLDTEPEIGAKLREHLDKYIIADDVTLADETEQWAVIGLEGPKSNECAEALAAVVPDSWAAWKDAFTVPTAATGPQGVRIFVPPQRKSDLVQRLQILGIPNATREEARVVRLENGVPRYGEDISDRYLAHETQQLHAIHTNKGCYLGQEIVERVRSRGQVHRLLTPIRVHSVTAPAAGTKLESDGKDVGEITSAVYSPALGEVVGLAYVRTEALNTKREMKVAGSGPEMLAAVR